MLRALLAATSLSLAIPAAAVLLELNHAITLGQMLVMLVAAVCCFSSCFWPRLPRR